MVAEEVVSISALARGRGVTLRKNQGQGVTPCESSAAAAKGDLCSRSDSPSRLSVRALLIFSFVPYDGTHDEVFLKIATV